MGVYCVPHDHVPADKGGAILIVHPDLLVKKTMEKLNNTDLYTKLAKDTTHELHNALYKTWVLGKTKGFITAEDAKEVMGVSDNPKKDGSGPANHPSPLPHYKPGRGYFYPALKIHKLDKSELAPGCEPPVRMITALHDGVSKRSDVYLTDKFLGQLEEDFCGDRLMDNTVALIWLDELDKTLDKDTKSNLNSFTFDFKSLND